MGDSMALLPGWGRRGAEFLSTGVRTGVFSSLANVLCTYPVLKPVRVWGCGNRRPTREGQISTGWEVLRVINAE